MSKIFKLQINMYRPGAIGALIDIYQQAITDFKKTIEAIPDDALTIIADPYTTDENCRSMQTILSHVVHSGYGYAASIRHLKVSTLTRPGKTFHSTISEYIRDLDNVFIYTENVFKEIQDSELSELNDSLKIRTGWDQVYDIEQLTEHAIVHILRNNRQIEKLKRSLLNSNN